MTYVLYLGTLVALYSILAQSLNLCLGYGGLLSLSHAAFFGCGAYATALLQIRYGVPFGAAVAGAISLNAAIAWVIGRATLRLRGDYFVLATLAFQAIVFAVLYNWTELTRGPYGIPKVPRPWGLGFSPADLALFALFSIAIAILVTVLAARLYSSPFGRSLRALRDDPTAALALGKDVTELRTAALVWSAMIAAVAGGLYASAIGYIDPTSFTLDESVFVLSALVIGGAGSLEGPIIGAAVVVLLPEALRLLGVPDAIAGNIRQMLYGALLIGLMFLRPRGISGSYGFD